MDIANLIIRVTNEGLDRATRELRRLQENAAGAQAANERFGKSIADLNKLAMVGFGALTGVVALSTKRAIEFESVMGSVAKVVDETANTSIKDISDALKDLSKTTPLSVDALGEIAAAGGSLGVVADDIIGFTDTVSKMAVAFDMSADMAGDAIANLSTVLGKPIDEMKAYGDMINQIADTSSAKASEIVSGMLEVGGAFKAFGVADDYALALTSTLITMGKSGSEAGTVFKRVLNVFGTLDVATKSTIGSFDKLGIDIDRFSGLMKTDATAAIEEYSAALLAVPSGERIGLAAQTFGGAYANDIVAALTNTEKFNAILGEIEINADGVSKALGSLEREYETVSATTANKLQLVKNNIDLVAISIGDAFLPAVNDLILAVVPMIEKLGAWAQANPELVVTIAKVVAVVTGAIIAIAAISSAVGAAISIFTGLSAIFALVAAEVGIMAVAIASPLVIIGLLIAAGIALYMNWDLVKKKASELGAWISTVWNKIKWDILQAATGAKESAIAKFNEMKTSAVNKVNEMAAGIVNAVKKLPSQMVQIGKDIAMGLVNGIKSGAVNVKNAAVDMAKGAWTGTKSFLNINSPSKVFEKIGDKGIAGGMAKGIKKGAKAVKSEAQKMAESAVKAVQDGVAGLKRELALFGNDSALAALDYDIKVGKFGGANTGELRSLTGQLEAAKAEAKAKDTLAAANKSVQDSIDGLIKQQALFGNSSSLASLMYDIEHTEKYKNITQELKDELIAQTKAFEQLGMTAKATQAIQERFAKLKTDQEASGKAVDGVMGELQAETAIGKIQADYERRIEVIRKHEELTTGLIGSEEAKRVAIYESAQKAKELIQIQGNEKLFGELSSITKTFFGEQSAAHRAMFAVEKYFALKRILVENKVALAKAWASAAFPYNLPAIATVAAQTGLLAAAVKGFKSGGYTGNMGASQVAGVVHGQEYVFDAQSTKRIGVDNLNAMRSGNNPKGGGDVNITVNNMSSAKVETQKDDNGNIVMTIRDEIKRSWTNTGNPNSFESKQLNRNIQAPRRR